jgi:hypothetical protein
MHTHLLRFGGILLFAVGVVWLLQGVGVVPGSYMSGQHRWAVIGAIVALLGLRLWLTARRRR